MLKNFDKEKYEQFVANIDHHGIELKSFYADTTSYENVRHLSKDKILMKAFSQPIQILYFNKKDSLISVQANCYAKGGLTNLNWNTDNRFNQFVPKSAINVKSAELTLSDFSRCYPNNLISSDKKYTVIIYWTLMLEKISRSAIKMTIDNIRQFHKEKEVTIYLINNDKSFIQK
ncbi:MAG: hypothetical protein IRZ03_17060 [Acidobacterium ailaaui]|nr:hypothetical protein [Pseudacidobacterium ailaaui]